MRKRGPEVPEKYRTKESDEVLTNDADRNRDHDLSADFEKAERTSFENHANILDIQKETSQKFKKVISFF